MQPVNLIVSCTNRKKALPPPELCLNSLRSKSLALGLEEWLERLAARRPLALRASELYAGDHWQVVQAIPREAAERNLGVRVWICSAGYGLIRDSDPIKPYSATFATRHPDSVNVLAPSGAGSAEQEWWSGLGTRLHRRGSPRSLVELARAEPCVPVIVVAAESYLLAMSADLLGATAALASEDLLSIVSVGATSKRIGQLRAHILPADARFEAVVGGTRAALNARLARHLFRQLPKGARPSREVLALTLAHAVKELPPLRHFNRRRLSDQQVSRFIEKERLVDPVASKSRLLKCLRGSGAACEQDRFGAIFDRVSGGSSDVS